MQGRPSLLYRISDRVNVLVWRAPLPKRVRLLLSALVYRNPPITAANALAILGGLDAARVPVVVMGGWGVDALAGRQRRKHRDLDLIVDYRDLDGAISALGRRGYEEWHRSPFENSVAGLEPRGEAVALRDASLRVVELHPMTLRESPSPLPTGTIGGHPVRCLSARQQIEAHSHYGRFVRLGERGGRRDLRFARDLLAASESAQAERA